MDRSSRDPFKIDHFPGNLACVDLSRRVMTDLATLADFLVTHPAVADKAAIHLSYGHALGVSGNIRLGDDCAAIENPSGSGHLLFAAEGMRESFVESDPWFAGYSAIVVNLADIAAMGGRPVAITDILWSPSDEISSKIWQGMQEAALAYGVPIVGGDTTRSRSGSATLGAAVIGHAGDRLITSFDAKPGDSLVLVIDMHGGFLGGDSFWNSSTITPPERLRAQLEMLPALVEKGLCRAGKDVSSGGIIGTLMMLCHCSEVGAVVNLEDVPCPMDVEIERWLTAFPTYGYLLAISPEDVKNTMSHFTATRITCREIGRFKADPGIVITADGEAVELRFPEEEPLHETLTSPGLSRRAG
ncbi:MAG: sll0787 family AIR synthase-like protein [Verrucomicrobiaceae bacterium]|nr:MAG: sll0787 family AIR synthase-like protein [Verrucomicrobiaceae bacterium]